MPILDVQVAAGVDQQRDQLTLAIKGCHVEWTDTFAVSAVGIAPSAEQEFGEFEMLVLDCQAQRRLFAYQPIWVIALINRLLNSGYLQLASQYTLDCIAECWARIARHRS
jgi:hypothetical protein